MNGGPTRQGAVHATAAVAALILLSAAAQANQESPTSRIIGGSVQPNLASAPFLVSVQRAVGATNLHKCTGTALSATTVLTSANCVLGAKLSALSILAGVADLSTADGFRVGVASVQLHPAFKRTRGLVDVALLTLKSPGIPTTVIAVGAFPWLNNLPVFELAATKTAFAGWAVPGGPESAPKAALATNFMVVPKKTCGPANGVSSPDPFTPYVVCAGAATSGPCVSTSGEPLFIQDNSGAIALVGTSVSQGGCLAGSILTPAPFVSIRSIRQWIAAASKTTTPADPTTPARIDMFNTRPSMAVGALELVFAHSATREKGEPTPSSLKQAYPGGTVWFTFTPTAAGQVKVETSDCDYDTTLAVYTGTKLTALTVVAANDDCVTDDAASCSCVTITAQAGVAYSVQVGGAWGAGGSTNVQVSSAA